MTVDAPARSARLAALVVLVVAAVGVVVVVVRRPPAAPAPAEQPAKPAPNDEAMMTLALQTILSDARSEAVGRCRANVTPPTTVELSIAFKTVAGGFEVERVTPLSMEELGRGPGDVATVQECVRAAFGGRRLVLPKPPFAIPEGQAFEVTMGMRIEPLRANY